MEGTIMDDDEINEDEIDVILEDFPQESTFLISILQRIQEEFGFLPKNAMELIGKYLNLSDAKIYEVASFYNQFRFEPLGEYVIKVCHGTACHVKGAENITEILEDMLDIECGETTEDKLFSLDKVACLGCCSLAPAMVVNETVYGHLNKGKLVEIVEDYRNKEHEK